MLSHPAHQEPEDPEVADGSPEESPESGHSKRRSTVAEMLGRLDREFFRDWFIEGPKLVLSGRFSKRDAVFMGVAAAPALLAVSFISLPALLFPTPEHHAFFHFAQSLRGEAVSLVPILIGVASCLFSLRIPLGSS